MAEPELGRERELEQEQEIKFDEETRTEMTVSVPPAPPPGPTDARVLPVQVALHLRPILPHEEAQGCVSSVRGNEDEHTVTLPGGTRRFTFDHVFEAGSERCSADRLYEGCVRPLLDGCFEGLNATVLAYGQTGSGKTFTMGTTGEDRGVIPRVARDLFARIDTLRAQNGGACAWDTSVSFFEIYRESTFDLLADAAGHGKAPELSIREDSTRNVFVVGLTEVSVRDKDELLEQLRRGGEHRATASTEMNSVSSRSHAIFTISLRNEDPATGMIRSSKFHLVDLAGSERAKRTKAQGDRLQEGININRGLLALGNVISALGDDKRKPGGKVGHVPYRDSKLTRILQDSLGGNSRTVMVACVSPADSNVEETLNTLKYANRARNIQNKPTVNDEAMNEQNSTLVAQLKRTIASLQDEVAALRSGSERPLEAHRAKISTRETSQLLLKLSDRNLSLEARLGRIAELVENAAAGADSEAGNAAAMMENSRKPPALCLEALRKALSQDAESPDVPAREEQPRESAAEDAAGAAGGDDGDDDEDHDEHEGEKAQGEDDEAQEVEHMQRQVALQQELQFINDELSSKVEAMAHMERSGSQFSEMERSYAKAVQEMCHELNILQNERDDLVAKLKEEQAKRAKLGGAQGAAPAVSGREKALKQKLADLEAKHSSLKKKQTEQERLIRIQKRDMSGMDRLKQEIQGLKQSRVKLMRRIKEEGDEFRKWKQTKERELKQMKKQETKQRYKYMVLERQHERQQRFLQRKQEEAALAQKRLRDVLQKQKQAASTRNGATGTGLGKSAEEQRAVFKEWLADQLQVSRHLRSARKALRAEVETRKALPPGSDDAEVASKRRACTERIASLQAAVLEAEEAAQTDRRWSAARTTHIAKQWLRILYQELASCAEKLDAVSEENDDLRTDNDDLQKMFLDLEHQHVLEKARVRREYEEKLVFMLQQHQQHPGTPKSSPPGGAEGADEEASAADAGAERSNTETVLLEKLDQLGADYDQLVALLEDSTPSKSKAAVKARKTAEAARKKRREQEDDDDDNDDDEPLWLSSESESEEGELDSDDEDWTEDSPAKAQRAVRKRASGPSLDSQASKKSVAPSTEDIEAMRHSAEDQLPEDLIERIDSFKVKELQDALFHIGLSVSGRKDVLRARLLCGLLDRQAQRENGTLQEAATPLLPEVVPSRHEVKQDEDQAAKQEDDHVAKQEVVSAAVKPPLSRQPSTKTTSAAASEPEKRSLGSTRQTPVNLGDVKLADAKRNSAPPAAKTKGLVPALTNPNKTVSSRTDALARPKLAPPRVTAHLAKGAPAGPDSKENSMEARLAQWRAHKKTLGESLSSGTRERRAADDQGPGKRRALGVISQNQNRAQG